MHGRQPRERKHQRKHEEREQKNKQEKELSKREQDRRMQQLSEQRLRQFHFLRVIFGLKLSFVDPYRAFQRKLKKLS